MCVTAVTNNLKVLLFFKSNYSIEKLLFALNLFRLEVSPKPLFEIPEQARALSYKPEPGSSSKNSGPFQL